VPDPQRYLIATANQGTAATPLVVNVGAHMQGGAAISRPGTPQPPVKGDIMWLFHSANNIGQPVTGVTDTAGAQWVKVGEVQPGATAPQTNQPCSMWIAVAPRDYTTADTISPAVTANNNQRACTVKAAKGIGTSPLAVVSYGVPTATGLAFDSGPGPPIPAPSLRISGMSTGACSLAPTGQTFGQANMIAWQASTNQWQATTEEWTTAPVASLRQAGAIAANNTWSVIVLALAVLVPLRTWDGDTWHDLAATGARVWDGSSWLTVA
jgi:hypothetical protein